MAELTWQAWFTVAVVVCLFTTLLATKLRTDMAFLGAVIALYVSGILDLQSAFGGIASSSVLVVAAMFAVIAGLDHTGVLNWIVRHLMGTPKSRGRATSRVMLTVAAFSAFLNNTTVVALFVNVVKKWSDKLGIKPSKLLIPLSYAAGMGGICTLVGTPPNMLISDFYAQETGNHMTLFTPLLCGLFCLAIGILATLAMSKLLPDRVSPMDFVKTFDFTTELTVPSDSPLVGKEVAESLVSRNIRKGSVDIIAIRRFDNYMVTPPVADDEIIMGGDRIMVAGCSHNIEEFAHKMGFQNDFLEAVVHEDDSNRFSWKTAASAIILVASMALAALDVLPLLHCCLLAAVAMIALGCCTPTQSFHSIDWRILVIFSGSIAIGKAIQDTGLAQLLATKLLVLSGSSPFWTLACICLIGTFITEFISNTAAAAIFYPIAMSAATTLGANPMTFCIALMISVSSSFATPIGSPTHMLVYGPGGYKFSDFARIGIPMNFIILAANLLITPLVFPF